MLIVVLLTFYLHRMNHLMQVTGRELLPEDSWDLEHLGVLTANVVVRRLSAHLARSPSGFFGEANFWPRWSVGKFETFPYIKCRLHNRELSLISSFRFRALNHCWRCAWPAAGNLCMDISCPFPLVCPHTMHVLGMFHTGSWCSMKEQIRNRSIHIHLFSFTQLARQTQV